MWAKRLQVGAHQEDILVCLAMLEIKPRALCMLGKHCCTELQSPAVFKSMLLSFTFYFGSLLGTA
jgi:hypothetical protein